jgi:hypothetical protein
MAERQPRCEDRFSHKHEVLTADCPYGTVTIQFDEEGQLTMEMGSCLDMGHSGPRLSSSSGSM